MSKVAFHTLGCKVNQYETEGVSELFKNHGYEIVDFDEKADVYVINTCTVTNLGDRKSRQMISKAKSTNHDAIVVVMGCYAQTAAEEISKIEGVSLIIGTKDRNKILSLVDEFKKSNNQINIVQNIMQNKEFEEIPISSYKDKTRAILKIQEGCNQFCSYCIIPYARGPIRSRKSNDIINEVNKLANHGFKEIVLTGIHIASYGKDFNENISLIDVINECSKIDGIERIRLGSLEPNIITKEFVEQLVNINKFCPQFHISLQSGCDETLKRMNRKYTTEQYRECVNIIRKYLNDASITTDIMVGFPGETEDEFEKSYNFAKEISFSKIHVFKYSPRKGTPAAKYDNQVLPQIKEQRSNLLIKLSNECEIKFYNKFIGTKQDVLFEQKIKNSDKLFEGLTNNYIKVVVEGNVDLLGEITSVELKEVKDDHIFGIVEK